MTKAQLTLIVAVIIFFGGTFYGAKLLTAKADTSADGPSCESRTVKTGEKVTTNLVTINVYNSSQRSGLANRASINLQRNGFLGGKIGNAKDVLPAGATVGEVAILTSDRTDPRIKLVAKQFGQKVKFLDPGNSPSTGVSVVVGDDYTKLVKKPPLSVTSDRTLEFCLPFVPVS